MKSLAIFLAALGLCCGLANAHTDPFEDFFEQDVAFNKRYLQQYKRDAQLRQPLHTLPKVQRREKRAVLASDCPAGYTGLYCENPLCDKKVPIKEHNRTYSVIEKRVVKGCNDKVTIYVDSHLVLLKILVQTDGQSFPGGTLYNTNNDKIFPTGDKPTIGSIHTYTYGNLIEDHGTGIYTFAPTSRNDDDCTVTASSTTDLAVYGGFVRTPFDDSVQEDIARGTNIQKNPINGFNSYLGFAISNASVNDAPKYVSFHRGDNSLEFPPFQVRPRYNCYADQFVGPYMCMDEGDYLLKVRGLDDSGSIWQRVYTYSCDPGRRPPEGSTTPAPPVLTCENGGTLIKQNKQNVCFCGPHFYGTVCENKRCDNEGTLGKEGECQCKEGFGGKFCEHVSCTDRDKPFNLDKRGLTFVVRAHKNANVLAQIQRAANITTSYFEDKHPGFFEEYALVLTVNGDSTKLTTATTAEGFVKEIADTADKWYDTTDCTDNVYSATLEGMLFSTTRKYFKSPIILFTDALPNDDDSTINYLGESLSHYKNSLFTIFYGGGTDGCDPDERDPEYIKMQGIAQYTGGLTVHTSAEGNAISDAASALAVGFMNNNLLTGYDLIFSCQYAPETQLFFVDESIQKIAVVSTGPSTFKIGVIDTNENKITPTSTSNYGNMQVSIYNTLTKGHYRLSIAHGGQYDSCTYRVYAETNYEAFFGATTQVNVDRAFNQPIYNRDVHLVGAINALDFPDPENLFAEVVIWQESREITKGDNRVVLYASNGIYRDGCTYNLYFGQWRCTERDRMFYVNMYVTDLSGYTVLRTTTGQCATNSGPPQDGECRNGGVKYDNGCICPAGWKDDDCQTAICYNGGTPHGDHCNCLVGYGGIHCQLNRCPSRNDDVSFRPLGISFALVVQNSFYLRGPLSKMKTIAPQVVHNLQSMHKNWIKTYSFWDFDQTDYDFQTKSPFAEDLITEINEFFDARQNAKYFCNETLLLDVLIAVLSDRNATENMIVYTYVYGGMKRDLTKQKRLFELIDLLGAKIHIVQANNVNCFAQTAPEMTTIRGIAHYSGGTYSTSFSGATLQSLPLQYSSGNVYHEHRDKCTGKQTFYFPVDSETQTISLRIFGDIYGDPKFTPPGESSGTPIRIYSGGFDSLFVAMRGCQDGWRQLNERCYRSEPQSGEVPIKSWEDARAECFRVGGVLATISSAEIDGLLRKDAGGFSAWIGLNDKKAKGTWEWDEGISNAIPWNPTSSYNGFKSGQPNKEAGECVAWSPSGWYVENCDTELSFICSTHAYNMDYDPGSSSEGHLARGLWTVEFDTWDDDVVACGLEVDVQSGIQVFRRFDTLTTSDEGNGQATYNFDTNYQLVHVESSLDSFNERATLEYGHFYPGEGQDLAFVTRMSPRVDCSYEYISDAFNPTEYAYSVGYTGFDAFGYPYQRIIPAVAFNNKVSCINGGVEVKDNNRCVCPPEWTDRECTKPVCDVGFLAPSQAACDCFPGYVGKFCQFPNCTRGQGEGPPPISNTDRTFTLILDGSRTGKNKDFLENFKDTLDSTLSKLGGIEQQWFSFYAAIIAYGSDHGNDKNSEIIGKKGRADFETAVLAALDPTYEATTPDRYYMRALVKILGNDSVKVGSPVYIIGDSAIEDWRSYNENIRDLIAQKHLIVSTIILDDERIPGGKNNYRDPTVEPFLRMAYTTGGNFYQVKGIPKLPMFWSTQLAAYFSSYSVSLSSYTKCADKTEFFQVGGEDNNIAVDIFSPLNQSVVMYDPNGAKVSITGVQKSDTNYLFSVKATVPGVWRVVINHTNKTGYCTVAIRSTRSDAPAVGFNNDVGDDSGMHSQGSAYSPSGDKKNSIIASSKTDYLRYVHVYTHNPRNFQPSGTLVYTSPLVKRTEDCKWNYAAKYLFTCPDSSFTVAIEGSDPAGHQFRRLYHTHCINYEKTMAANGIVVPELNMFQLNGTVKAVELNE